MTTALLIVAAGSGERFGRPKWSVPLVGKSLLEWNLNRANELPFIDHIVLVVQNKDMESVQQLADRVLDGRVTLVSGGDERVDSVSNGLEAVQEDLVLIHNVANPMAAADDFLQLYEALLKEDCACFVGQPVVDTLRRITEDNAETIDRTHMWRVQTPQGFRTATLKKQIEKAAGESTTDEIMLYHNSGIPIRAFSSTSLNQKITFPEDLEQLERTVQQPLLVGIGEDSHPLDDSGEMMLGGIAVDGLPKLKGNSDGDLILHALFNAISSALGQRSIGPTADPLAEQGVIDSAAYLQIVLDRAQKEGYRPYNVSISLECLRPKIEPLVDRMKERLSSLLKLDPLRIGITATTGEGMGERSEQAIFCRCVVSLIKLED